MTTADERGVGEDRRWLLNLAWILLTTDLALIVLHVVTGWDAIDLDREGNVSTWYSSAKLLGLALLAARAHLSMPRSSGRAGWLVAAVLFGGLSVDETASVHESLARWLLGLPGLAGLRATLTGGDDLKTSHAWVWLLLPAIVLVAAWLIRLFATRLRGQRSALVLCSTGLACLLAAVGLEAAVTGFPEIADWGAAETRRYRMLTTVEEGCELAGITLLFAALTLHVGRADD